MTLFGGVILTLAVLIFASFLSLWISIGVNISRLIWPLFWIIPHPHLWRPLTSATDYGCGGSRHWGDYHGADEHECVLCGLMRTKYSGSEPYTHWKDEYKSTTWWEEHKASPDGDSQP